MAIDVIIVNFADTVKRTSALLRTIIGGSGHGKRSIANHQNIAVLNRNRTIGNDRRAKKRKRVRHIEKGMEGMEGMVVEEGVFGESMETMKENRKKTEKKGKKTEKPHSSLLHGYFIPYSY